MRIRPAVEADARAIARVHIDAWRATYRGIVPDETLAALDLEARTTRWRENLGKPGFTLVIEREGEAPFGFASAGPDPDSNEGGELYAIYLGPNELRKGAGRALVRRVAIELAAAGLRTMTVWVLAANSARKFYEALGGRFLSSKSIEIGGAALEEVSYGWDDLRTLTETPRAD